MNKRTYHYLERSPSLPCSSGDRFKDRHILLKDGDNLLLKKVGRIDTVEQINSHLDGVCLSKMIERFNRSGDPTVFGASRGFYGDVSGYATDPLDVINNTREILPKMEELAAAAQQHPADQSSVSVPKTEKSVESEVTPDA